jgi:predicted NBD/HSP70 family sugar kinase
MTEPTVAANSGDRAELGGSAVAPVLAAIDADGGVRTDGDFNALAMLVIDCAIGGDTESLTVLQDWLRDERAQAMAGATDAGSALEGRLLGLIDVSHWAIERALPLADLAVLEPGSHANSFVEELSIHPGRNSTELAERLGVEESEVSRVGKKLRNDGLVLQRRLGRQKLWELTPKGRRSLEMVKGVMRKSGGPAAEELEGDQPDEAMHWAVGGAIITLINQGKLRFRDLREEVANMANVAVGVADEALQQLAKSKLLTPHAPRSMISLNEGRPTALGVLITSTEVVGVLTGPVGNGLTDCHRRALPSTEVDTVVASIAALVEEILQVHNESPDSVVGLGVILAGHVDGRSGSVVFSPDLTEFGQHWRNVPLRQLLEEATSLPTVVENDVNALAVHEQLFGLGHDVSDFAVVFVGKEGVGCGLVVGGTLVHGSEGIAGEFGHIVVEPGGEKCRCGNSGCLETIVSIAGIRRALAESEPDIFDDPLLIVGQERYEKVVNEAFSRAGRTLGFGLAHMLNLTNPAKVIIVGPPMLTSDDAASARTFMKATRDSAEQYSFSFATQNYDIVFKSFDDTWGPIGAAASAVISRLVGRRMRLFAAARRGAPGRLLPEVGTQELAQRLTASWH